MVVKAPFLQVTPEGICVWVKPVIIPRPLHPQGRQFSLESRICEENSSLIVIYGMPEPNKGFQCRTR